MKLIFWGGFMKVEWYYIVNDEKKGPISSADLKKLALEGHVKPTDMVWKEGLQNWISANSIKGLFQANQLSLVPLKAPPPVPVKVSSLPEKQQLITSKVPKSPIKSNGLICWIYRRIFEDRTNSIAKLYLQGGPNLPPNYPWSEIERRASNGSLQTYQLVFAIFFPITLLLILSVYGIPFTLFTLAFVLLPYSRLNPRRFRKIWKNANGEQVVEFRPGNIAKLGEKWIGHYYLLPNQEFIDFFEDEKLVDSWKIIEYKDNPETLVIQDISGNNKTLYTKDAQEEKNSSRYKEKKSREAKLIQKWDPVIGEGPSIQFTSDGAMIRFDGFAARYTFSGEHPNEIITLHMDQGNNIQLKVLSLGQDELVLADESGTAHYKRGVSISAVEAKKREDEAKKRSDEFNEKVVAVGKTAAVVAGVAALGALAVVASASVNRCRACGNTIASRPTICQSCGAVN